MKHPASLTIFIPGIPSNTNRSGHMGSGKWQPVHERAKFRELTAEIAYEAATTETIYDGIYYMWEPYPYTIITARHISPVRRRRDPLGLAERLKSIMDGLVDVGVIPDDDELHIEVQLLPSRKGPTAGILLTLYGANELP